MIPAVQIHPNMPVVCSQNGQFAVVDKVEGQDIKLMKDKAGKAHLIPLDWVTDVDDKVHIKITGDEAMAQWRTVH